MTEFQTIADLDVASRAVLVRADLNVPLIDGGVGDDYRIRSSLPTIEALRSAGAGTVVVCSHLGRPSGPDPSLSMTPVAERLAELGGFEVTMAPEVSGPAVEEVVAGVSGGGVVMLENTRFEAGEKANAPELADGLARLADLFVLDAFGSAHRAHASTVGVAERIPSAAGLLMSAELAAFDRLLHHPERPYVVLLGGAKVSDKLGVMRALLPKVDVMLIGGAMCFTLLAAEGYDVGDSRVEFDMVEEVRDVLDGDFGGRVSLPLDLLVAGEFASEATFEVVASTSIPAGTMGLDIGPDTRDPFGSVIESADTIFWNGPMGVFEWDAFAGGTLSVARAVAASTGYTVAGGGDSVAALRSFGMEDSVSHLSTGGGAGLELLESGTLPGVRALERWTD